VCSIVWRAKQKLELDAAVIRGVTRASSTETIEATAPADYSERLSVRRGLLAALLTSAELGTLTGGNVMHAVVLPPARTRCKNCAR
jgi:hypothetical protein